jgi:hypothetical protein
MQPLPLVGGWGDFCVSGRPPEYPFTVEGNATIFLLTVIFATMRRAVMRLWVTVSFFTILVGFSLFAEVPPEPPCEARGSVPWLQCYGPR